MHYSSFRDSDVWMYFIIPAIMRLQNDRLCHWASCQTCHCISNLQL